MFKDNSAGIRKKIIHPFQVNVHFYIPENITKSSGVFRGYRNGTWGCKGSTSPQGFNGFDNQSINLLLLENIFSFRFKGRFFK